jgi:hypothetical protein
VVPTAAAPQGAAAFFEKGFEKGVRNHLFLKKVSSSKRCQAPFVSRPRPLAGAVSPPATGKWCLTPFLVDTFFGAANGA